MRILFVSYLHPAIAPGGAQQIAYEMFRASEASGHEAFLLCALEAEHEAEFGKPGAPIVPMQGEARQYFYFPQYYDFTQLSVRDWRTLRFFGEFVERIRPDVIHFHHYHRIGVESVRAARVAAPQATICMTLHEMMAICLANGQMLKRPSRELCHASGPIPCNRCFPEHRPEFFTLRARRLRAILADCDSFVFPSEFLAERYLDWGLPGGKCAVIPNGLVDLGRGSDRHGHSAALNRFGFFGQFLDNKGIDIVLDALIILGRQKRLPQAGILLEINGGNRHYATPAYLERVAGKIAEIGRLTGPIEVRDRGAYGRHDLARRMATVDWVLVPSTWWEVFGLVVSEAWMFGRPVIASAIGGLAERVTDGVDGLLVPPRDAEALAERMAGVVGNAPLWQKLNGGIKRTWSEGDMLAAHVRLWGEMGGEGAARTGSAPAGALRSDG